MHHFTCHINNFNPIHIPHARVVGYRSVVCIEEKTGFLFCTEEIREVFFKTHSILCLQLRFILLICGRINYDIIQMKMQITYYCLHFFCLHKCTTSVKFRMEKPFAAAFPMSYNLWPCHFETAIAITPFAISISLLCVWNLPKFKWKSNSLCICISHALHRNLPVSVDKRQHNNLFCTFSFLAVDWDWCSFQIRTRPSLYSYPQHWLTGFCTRHGKCNNCEVIVILFGNFSIHDTEGVITEGITAIAIDRVITHNTWEMQSQMGFSFPFEFLEAPYAPQRKRHSKQGNCYCHFNMTGS